MANVILQHGFALPARARRRDYLTPAALSVLLALAAVLVARIVLHVLYPYPIDSGEGCVLAAAWHIAKGLPVYEIIARPPYLFAIYNPLYLYLGGLSMYLFGPTPIAIRLISVAFFLGIALFIYLFVRRETGSRTAGLVAALFVLVERHFFSRAAYAVTDFQALFFSILGLYLWRSGGRARYLAPLSFALAFFTKQTSMLVAAAAFSSLFLEGRRRESLALFGVFLVLLGVGLGICGLLFGKAYFANTITYASFATFDRHAAVVRVAHAAMLYFVPFIAWLFLAARSLRDRRYLLPAAYVLFAFLFAFTCGREGASRSYVFDFGASLAVVLGLAWPAFAARAAVSGFLSPVTAVAALQIALVVVGALSGFTRISDRAAFLQHDAEISAAYKSHSGMIMCRDHGFSLGAKADNLATDLYRLGQLVDAGAVSPEVFLDPIRGRSLAMVIMKSKDEDEPGIPFAPYVRAAVKENYTVAYEKYGELFMIPRER